MGHLQNGHLLVGGMLCLCVSEMRNCAVRSLLLEKNVACYTWGFKFQVLHVVNFLKSFFTLGALGHFLVYSCTPE